MQKIILLLTSFVICISCSDMKEIEISESPIRTVVVGKANNHSSNETTISLSINRVGFEQEEFEASLDSLGNFKLDFLTYLPVDVWVTYQTNFLVVLKPGDSLYVEFDAAQEKRPELLETIKFGGNSAENNRLISICQKLYYSSHLYLYGYDKPYNSLQNAYKNYEPYRFKEFADSIRQEGNAFLSSYIKQYHPTKFAESWAKYFIDETYFDILTWYPDNHRKANVLKQNEWNVPVSYYNYFNEYPYEIEEGLHSGYSIGNYLDKYRMYMYALGREKLKEYTPEKSEDLWDSIMLNIIVANTQSSSLREVTLSYQFASLLKRSDVETFEKNKHLIDENIHSAYLKEPLFEKYETVKRKIEGQATGVYNKVESLNKLMEGVISKNKGMVTYVDIWATWCGPCREEFPYSRKLQQTFSNEMVSFVYICIESKQNTFENTLKEFELDGTHYFLNTEQSAELRKELEIDGIPVYLLIDKNGKVVSEKYRPSDDLTKKQIEKLINE